jgi:hypothetical protein
MGIANDYINFAYCNASGGKKWFKYNSSNPLDEKAITGVKEIPYLLFYIIIDNQEHLNSF